MTAPDPAHVAAIAELLADGTPRSAAAIRQETGIGDLGAVFAALEDPRFVRVGIQQQHSNVRGGGSVDQDLWGLAS